MLLVLALVTAEIDDDSIHSVVMVQMQSFFAGFSRGLIRELNFVGGKKDDWFARRSNLKYLEREGIHSY